MTDQRRVVVLGSTGSIGTQAIAVAQAAPDRFRVTAILPCSPTRPLRCRWPRWA
jgi:1-deoxy-D-xylulose 5-phosphate reductoisomerase